MRRVLSFALLALPVLAGGREDVPFLVASLESPMDAVAEDAQRSLLILGPATLPLLRSAAEDELVRRNHLGPRVERLIRELDSDEYETRERAQLDLEEIGREALPALREAAANGTPEQQERAHAAIGRIESSPPIPPRFLIRLSRAIALQADDASVPTLLALARQPEPEVFLVAIDGLRLIGTNAARGALVELGANKLADRRWAARAALAALGEPVRLNSDEFLSDWPSDPVRERLYRGLGSCESPDVLSFAFEAMPKDKSIIGVYLRALLVGLCDDAGLTREALRRIPSAAPDDRRHLYPLLREPTPEAISALTRGLADTYFKAQIEAMRGLARLQGPLACAAIRPLLRDPNRDVRLAAVEALAAIDEGDPSPFREALEDPEIATAALEPYLVRLPGAEKVAALPDRVSGPNIEEAILIERLISTAVSDPVLAALAEGLGNPWKGERARSVRGYARQSVGSLLGPLPPRPVQAELDALGRLRAFRGAPARQRIDLPRGDLRSVDPDTRREATAWAVLDGLDGLEEEVLPLLQAQEPGTRNLARLYLARRRTDDLLDRVRRMALGAVPGDAPVLWVEWEGRDAAERLVARLREPGEVHEGIWEALARAPLRPEDAEALLARRPPGQARAARGAWLRALHRTGTPRAWQAIEVHATSEGAGDAWVDGCSSMIQDASRSDLALRLARAERLDESSGLDTWLMAFGNHAPATFADEVAARLDGSSMLSASFATWALVRSAPERARELALEWHSSMHTRRRVAAVLLSYHLGEEPPMESIQAALRSEDETLAWFLQITNMFDDERLTRACVPLLTSPHAGVRADAWDALTVRVFGTPPSSGNAFSVPADARRAWEGWLSELGDLGREACIRRALGDGPHDPEHFLETCMEAPLGGALAAWARTHEGMPIVGVTSDSILDEAAKWKDSLR